MWAAQLRRIPLALLLACSTSVLLPAQSQTGVQATTVFTAAPTGVAYDSAGNLYIALANDHVVRKVDTLGFITTVAGTGEQGFSGDNGAATSAQLDTPSGVAVDANGTLYIADTRNHRIRRVSNGTITTVAGTGSAGYSGDGGNATSAQLNFPAAVSIDSNGNLYIADTANQVIRKIVGGTITTVAGNGQQGYGGDNAAATAAQLDTPTGVSADPSVAGRFYIADRHNDRVRMVDVTSQIFTVAGTGQAGFSGDGGNPAAATLAGPRGVAAAPSGSVYVADTDNQRIRVLTNGAINTVAGTGEQGFAGDNGAPAAAVLDTPFAPALSTSGLLAFADTHNQRVRVVSGSQINTVAGIAPPLTESILVSGTTSGVFGASLGSLTATLSNNGSAFTGSVSLYRDGAAVATQPLNRNVATFSLAGTPGGLHTFSVGFGGDGTNGPINSGVYLINIASQAQTITFAPLPAQVTYPITGSIALSATSSSGLPVTYSATGPATVAGSTLTFTGPGTVTVTASQAGNSNFAAATPVAQTITVTTQNAPAIASLSPATAVLGAQNLPITVIGSGFTSTSVVQINGSSVSTTYVSATMLNAVLPALTATGAQSIGVVDTNSSLRSNPASLNVVLGGLGAQLSVPSTSSSGQQPTVNLQLSAAYPVPITGTLSLSFTPAVGNGTDRSIIFSNGQTSINFTVPANSTAVQPIALSTGTVAGTITLTLSLTAQGVDVTPAAARTATIVIPAQPPVITSTSLTQNEGVLTVVVHGYSNTRDMSLATFTFTAAPGSSLSTTSLGFVVTPLFATWFSDPASSAGGSTFTYTQTFNLSDGVTKVQTVGVQLTNTSGAGTRTQTPQ